MMTLDDIFDALFDGSRSQMEELAGSGAWYRYSEGCGAFAVGFDGDEIRAHKVFDPPKCVNAYGPEHTF